MSSQRTYFHFHTFNTLLQSTIFCFYVSNFATKQTYHRYWLPLNNETELINITNILNHKVQSAMTNQETSSESKSNSEEGPRSGDGATDMAEAEQKEKKGDDNVESSSSGSDGGKGSGSGGSGGAYSSDCSSSVTSSLEAAKRNVPDMETQRLSVGDDSKDKSVKTKETNAARSSIASVAESQEGSDSGLSASLSDEKSKKDGGEERKAAQDSRGFSYSAPQCNGVRINHPMDPRIDLSTVGHIQMSCLSTEFANTVNIPSQQNLDRTPSAQETNHGGVPTAPAPPSIYQYMTLMEVTTCTSGIEFDCLIHVSHILLGCSPFL
jgi:hypothetical protein